MQSTESNYGMLVHTNWHLVGLLLFGEDENWISWFVKTLSVEDHQVASTSQLKDEIAILWGEVSEVKGAALEDLGRRETRCGQAYLRTTWQCNVVLTVAVRSNFA